jgi:acyl-CoA thioesterase-2
MFDRNGTMVAAVVQEGLTRIQRDQDKRDIETGNMA